MKYTINKLNEMSSDVNLVQKTGNKMKRNVWMGRRGVVERDHGDYQTLNTDDGATGGKRYETSLVQMEPSRGLNTVTDGIP